MALEFKKLNTVHFSVGVLLSDMKLQSVTTPIGSVDQDHV